MSVLKASIASDLACKARKQLEEFNKDVIAKAKAEGTSMLVLLKTDETLQDYRNALAEFRENLIRDNPNASITYAQQPMLCKTRPEEEAVRRDDGIYGCLALGKMDGGEAKELGTGHAFMWREGEKHLFGDANAIYVGFRLFGKID